MRSNQSPEDYLKVVAKKKPRLQALLDNVDTMTQEAIDALGEPLWIRQALSNLKKNEGMTLSMYTQARINQAIAAEEEAAKLPKPTYEVRIWDSNNGYVGTEMQGSQSGWKIEMNPGDSFAIIDDHTVRVGDSMIRISEFDLTPLMHLSKFVGYMTLQNYKGFHRALVNEKHKHL